MYFYSYCKKRNSTEKKREKVNGKKRQSFYKVRVSPADFFFSFFFGKNIEHDGFKATMKGKAFITLVDNTGLLYKQANKQKKKVSFFHVLLL